MQVWSKSIHSYKRQGADKPFSNNLSPPVTLKMGSRSPKSNQFFYMSQQYRCASLVKIYSFLQEIGCRQAIFQQSKPSKPSCDLENGSRSPKSNQHFSPSQWYTCICVSLAKICPFNKEIECRQEAKPPPPQMGSNNMSPPPRPPLHHGGHNWGG